MAAKSAKAPVEGSIPLIPATRPVARTIGELRASGWRSRSVKAELRSNLLARLGEGRPILPGVIGYDESVLPAVENAILAGQDLVFLGERGQGKTRMARLLVGLLDPWLPIVAGGELQRGSRSRRSAPAARALVAEGPTRRRSPGCPATGATRRSWRPPTSRSPT